MEKMSLRLENITKSFGDRKILDHFTLDFRPGSITCLFGPSGCGKTTLLNLIGGMLTPDEGFVHGFGEGGISCIFQETRILPWKTVLGNVLFPLMDKMTDSLALETARKFIRLVGLENAEMLYPSQLSGGMKQRVSIARAFAYPGKTIIMDEAFQSLDNALKYNILDSFLQIWKEDGRTVIFVTHDIGEATRLGQQIIFLNNNPLKVIRSVNTADESAQSINKIADILYVPDK